MDLGAWLLEINLGLKSPGVRLGFDRWGIRITILLG